MNSTKVYQGQSFLDKTIENTGKVDNAFEMALLNNVSITDDTAIDQVFEVSKVTSHVVVAQFSEYNRPATFITQELLEQIRNKGIGFMTLRTDFIVG